MSEKNNLSKLIMGLGLQAFRVLLLGPACWFIYQDARYPAFFLLSLVFITGWIVAMQIRNCEDERPYYSIWLRCLEGFLVALLFVVVLMREWTDVMPKTLLFSAIFMVLKAGVYPLYAIALQREGKPTHYPSFWAKAGRLSVIFALMITAIGIEHWQEIALWSSILFVSASGIAFIYNYYRDSDHRKPLSIASQLTVSRIVLTPVFIMVFFYDSDLIYQNNNMIFKTLALLMIVGFMVTDFLDGYLARKMGEVSTLGKFLDPFSDKISNMTVFLCFMASGYASIWMVALIYFREASVETLRTLAAHQGMTMSARPSGKWKTAIQGGGILVILTGALDVWMTMIPGWAEIWPFIPQVAMGIITFATLASGVDYFYSSRDVLKKFL
jgi:CDP-diacylglycerol--glycerol-3-phosphate 3-phosphatidyltransferase